MHNNFYLLIFYNNNYNWFTMYMYTCMYILAYMYNYFSEVIYLKWCQTLSFAFYNYTKYFLNDIII